MIYRMQLADSVDEMTFDLLEVPIEDKDIEGTADNTTIDGNVFTDYLWLKKQFIQKWSLMCEDDYTQLRGFYTRQWENAEVPTYKLFVGENRSETLTASGSSFQIQNGTQYDAPLTLTELTGNATQNGTPTPDAPVAVNTTTGENVVKITGKNLAHNTLRTTEMVIGGVTVTPNDDGTVTLNGTATTGAWVNIDKLELPNGANIANVGSDTKSVTAGGYTFSCRVENGLVNFSYSAANYVVAVYLINGQTYNNAKVYIQIELGSTATSYEPYQGEEYEVNLGKNLIKFAGDSGTASFGSGVTATVLSNGIIKLNGTATGNGWLELIDPNRFLGGVAVSSTILFPLDTTQTYSVSCSLVSGSFSGSNATFNLIYTNTETSKAIPLGSSATITGGNGVCRGYVRVNNGNTFDNAIFSVQLEKGAATTYAPYFTPIELAKIGTYQDRIYKDDGKWYIEKKIEKRPLNYFTGWGNAGEGDTTNGTSKWTNIARISGRDVPVLCTHLKQLPFNNTDHTLTNFIMTGSNNVITINVANSSISTTFQDWLDTSGATLYFPKGTPTTTEITDSTLLAQLNFIANLYGGTNNIMLVGTGAQGEIEVQYTLTYEQEQVIIPETPVRLNLTDGGVINPCGCRQNVQLTMRETIQ